MARKDVSFAEKDKRCTQTARHKQRLRRWSEAHTSAHTHARTPAGAAVPTESGWRDKCVLKARLKGSLKEERLWQKCVPRDFLYFCSLLCTSMRTSVRTRSHACVQFPCKQVGPPLWRYARTQTHTYTPCEDYFRPINPIQQTLKII